MYSKDCSVHFTSQSRAHTYVHTHKCVIKSKTPLVVRGTVILGITLKEKVMAIKLLHSIDCKDHCKFKEIEM